MGQRAEKKQSGEQLPAKTDWELRIKVAGFVLAVLGACGGSLKWREERVNPDYLNEIKVCNELAEAAASVVASESGALARTELSKYEIIYRGRAHTTIRDKSVLAAKISFYHTAKEMIDQNADLKATLTQPAVRLSESCRAVHRPWY